VQTDEDGFRKALDARFLKIMWCFRMDLGFFAANITLSSKTGAEKPQERV
jgi:hypothetical protein